MKQVKGKPGPKTQYGPRKAYHFLLEDTKTGAFEQRARQEGGIVKYIVKLIDRDLELIDRPDKPIKAQ